MISKPSVQVLAYKESLRLLKLAIYITLSEFINVLQVLMIMRFSTELNIMKKNNIQVIPNSSVDLLQI